MGLILCLTKLGLAQRLKKVLKVVGDRERGRKFRKIFSCLCCLALLRKKFGR